MAFRVPEPHRVKDGPYRSTVFDGLRGCFRFPGPTPGRLIYTMADDGTGHPDPKNTLEIVTRWEHVSVSIRQGQKARTPSWEEMAFVKAVFWQDEDVVMQLHLRRSQYVNLQANTLHLWRPVPGVGPAIPEPPAILVGPVGPVGVKLAPAEAGQPTSS